MSSMPASSTKCIPRTARDTQRKLVSKNKQKKEGRKRRKEGREGGREKEIKQEREGSHYVILDSRGPLMSQYPQELDNKAHPQVRLDGTFSVRPHQPGLFLSPVSFI